MSVKEGNYLELIELKVKTRTRTGNGPARALRREGRIPAILYGSGTNPLMLSVPTKEFEYALQQSTASQPLFNLTVDDGGDSPTTVMIKELQTHPLSHHSLHVDFYRIDMDRKITVSVPVTTTGKCVGVEMGGMLQIIRRELEVLCLPMEIPDVIEVDVTDLEIGDSIHIQDIPLAGGLEVPSDVNFTVITVLSPTKTTEETGEEEELEEGEEAEESAGSVEEG